MIKVVVNYGQVEHDLAAALKTRIDRMRTIVFALVEPWKHFQNQPESGEKQQVGYFEVPSRIHYH